MHKIISLDHDLGDSAMNEYYNNVSPNFKLDYDNICSTQKSATILRFENEEKINLVDNRVADGSKVSKSSKVGEISFGYAGQKLSGGGTTQQVWGGVEFGSNKYKQFPVWSGREGRGSRGWFIYPTLRSLQPEIIKKWEESFSKIVKEYN